MKIAIQEIGTVIAKLATIIAEHPGIAEELLPIIHGISGASRELFPETRKESPNPSRIGLEPQEIEVGKTLGKEAVISLYCDRTGMPRDEAIPFIVRQFEAIGWVFDEDLVKKPSYPGPPGNPFQAPIAAPSTAYPMPMSGKMVYRGNLDQKDEMSP